MFILTFERFEENSVKKKSQRKSSFDLTVKNEEKACKKIIAMSWNNDYATGNLLDFVYFKENYRLMQLIWVSKLN